MKRIWCNFQIETQTEGHCFLYHLIDDRCTTNTIWKPYYVLNKMPCLWIQRKYEHVLLQSRINIE